MIYVETCEKIKVDAVKLKEKCLNMEFNYNDNFVLWMCEFINKEQNIKNPNLLYIIFVLT